MTDFTQKDADISLCCLNQRHYTRLFCYHSPPHLPSFQLSLSLSLSFALYMLHLAYMAEWKYNLKPFKQGMNSGPAAVRSRAACNHEMAALSSGLTTSPPSPFLISALLGRNIERGRRSPACIKMNGRHSE